MENKRILLGMLVIALAFGMTLIGCGGDGDDDNDNDDGPQWETPTGLFAQSFTGTLSENNTKMTITDWWGDQWTLTKSGGSLDGTWQGQGTRMTISGTSWTMAMSDSGGEKDPIHGGGGGGGDPIGPSELDMSVSRASAGGSYADVAKGTLTRNGSTVTFKATQIRMEGAAGDDVYDPVPPPSPIQN